MLIWVLQWPQCFKIRVAQYWGGRGHITVRTKVSGVKISRIFRKIQEKRCLFQRFVTSIVVGTSCPWASEDVLSELIRTAVVICLNPLTPKSDQYLFSLNNFNTFLRETVQRIYKIITKEEMFLSFIKILVSKRKSKE